MSEPISSEQLVIRLPGSLLARVDAVGAQQGWKRSAATRYLLEGALAALEKRREEALNS